MSSLTQIHGPDSVKTPAIVHLPNGTLYKVLSDDENFTLSHPKFYQLENAFKIEFDSLRLLRFNRNLFLLHQNYFSLPEI